MRTFLALLLSTLTAFGVEILPAARRYAWTNVGIAGFGQPVPVVSTIYTNLTPSGTGQDYTNILNALQNCPSNQIVKLGIGTFTFTNRFDFDTYGSGGNGNGIVLRGTLNPDGTKGTKLRANGGNQHIFYVRRQYNPTRHDDQALLSVDAVKGQRTLTLTSVPSWVTVGNLYLLDQQDDTNFVHDGETTIWENGDDFRYAFVTTALGHRGLNQLVLVTNITGNTLTIQKDLGYGFQTAQQASISGALYDVDTAKPITRVGLEDFVLEGNFSSAISDCIYFESARDCWIKNVEVSTNVGLVGIKFIMCYSCEVRDCYVHDQKLDGGGQGYGYGVFYGSSHILLQNNRYRRMHVGIQLSYGTSLCVSGYNFGGAGASASTSVTSWDAHGTGSYMNLVEGNWFSAQVQGDVVHGSSSHNVIFRNRIVGTNVYDADETCLEPDYYSRFYSIVGNVLGHSGTHTTYQKVAPSSCSSATDKVIMKIGFKNSYGCDSTCEGGGNCYDDLTASAVQLSVNYDVVTSTNGGVVLGGYSLADLGSSYYLISKPAEFGDLLSWPPYSPASPSANSQTNIPAGYLDFYGVNPPLSGALVSAPKLHKGGLKLTR